MLESLLPAIPANVAPLTYYLCVGGAVLITGISKAGFGGGVGILAIPLMATVVGPKEMLGITLPLLVACDIFSNLHHLGQYDSWKRFRPLVAGLVAGIAVGSLLLWVMADMDRSAFDHVMSCVVGLVCYAVVILQAYRLTGREVPTLPPHPASSFAVGTFAGTVSTLNHAAGPIPQIYLMQRQQDQLDKRRLVGTLLLYFFIGNSLKLIPYALIPIGGSPLINAQTLRNSIWFIPLIPVGTLIGAWMHHRVPEKPFAAIMYVAAGITAFQMIYKVSPLASLACGAAGLAIVVWAWVNYLRRPVENPAAVEAAMLEDAEGD